jgi:formyl-CoA transferase
MIVQYEHPTVGTVRGLGMPIQFSQTPNEIARPAPLIGEHTAEILREFGGYSDSEIRRLREQGVVNNGHS